MRIAAFMAGYSHPGRRCIQPSAETCGSVSQPLNARTSEQFGTHTKQMWRWDSLKLRIKASSNRSLHITEFSTLQG